MSNLLKKSIEAFRTAPIGVSRLAIGTPALLVNAELLIHSPEIYEALPLPFIAANIAIGGLKTARQQRLKARLEESIEKVGYDDRAFETTTGVWCARQTARVVCKHSGHLAEYEELCRKTEASADYKWLPHVP